MFCSNCGHPLVAGASFCSNCGARVVEAHPAESPAPPIAPLISAAPDLGAPAAPAAAPAPAAVWPPAAVPASPVRYAGFWRRFWAILLDGLILQILFVPISLIVSRPNPALLGGDEVTPGQIFEFLGSVATALMINAVIHWLYSALMESSARQATLGKMALGMRVTDLEGRRIGFGRASGRHFAKILSGMLLLIGYLIQPFTRRRQALHDLIAGTLIVRTED